MTLLKEEKGIALVTALMLTLITLTITMVMLYMVTQSTKISGAQKAYKSSLDAGLGGVDIMTKDALPYMLSATTDFLESANDSSYFTKKLAASMPGLESLHIDNATCLNAKLTKREADWGTACGSESKNLDPTKSPDISFVLKSAFLPTSAKGFKVSAKILSTTVGNTDLSNREFNTSSTTSASSGDIGSPYIYRLEVTGERESNPSERATLSVLYAY